MARAVEKAGFDAFFRSDHYLGIDPSDTGYRPTGPWTTLASLAVQTERVQLGTLMTTCPTFPPAGSAAIAVASASTRSAAGGPARHRRRLVEREHRFGIQLPRRSVAVRPAAPTARHHRRAVGDRRGAVRLSAGCYRLGGCAAYRGPRGSRRSS